MFVGDIKCVARCAATYLTRGYFGFCKILNKEMTDMNIDDSTSSAVAQIQQGGEVGGIHLIRADRRGKQGVLNINISETNLRLLTIMHCSCGAVGGKFFQSIRISIS